MKFLLATTLLLSLLALPAEAQERRRDRRSTSHRLEVLQQQRHTVERRGSHDFERRDFERRGFERRDSSPRRDYDPHDLEYRRDSGRRIRRGSIFSDSVQRDPVYREPAHRGSVHRRVRRRGRSVFGLSNDRGVVIFEPDRTLIIRQRDRDERRDVIHIDGSSSGVSAPGRLEAAPGTSPIITAPQQQEDPRLLHGERISPFAARVYAKALLAGYEGPSTVYPVITRFAPGQQVTAIQAAGGADGFQWYLVASDRQSAWVRGDRLLIDAR